MKIRKQFLAACLLVGVMTALPRNFSAQAQAVVTRPPSADSLLDQAYHAMYNLNFDEAVQRAEQAKTVADDDPMPWIAEACSALFREFDRLHILNSEMFVSDEKFSSRPAYSWDPNNRWAFERALRGAERVAQRRLSRDKNDSRALFAMALSNGLQADDAALIGKKNLSALGFTKSATGYAERLLALAPDYYDAYLSTGLGKYIIGGKAAPVRWVLRLGGLKGDQEEGVRELRLTAEHGRFLAPFARILLAFDDLRHKNTTEARRKFAWLHDQFPGNPLFTVELEKIDHHSARTGE